MEKSILYAFMENLIFSEGTKFSIGFTLHGLKNLILSLSCMVLSCVKQRFHGVLYHYMS